MNNEINQKRRSRRYKKIAFNITMFLILIIFGTLLLNKSVRYQNTEAIEYTERSNLDYKVFLLKNDFYEQPYLGKDMLYVASLINKINLDFKYKFEVQEEQTIDFNYKIIGKLSITNSEGTKAYFEKTYTLVENKIVHMKNATSQNIVENIEIDYPYYNSLANSFKNSYGIDTESNLTVYMVIDKINDENNNFKLDNGNISIKIPLSERSVNIELDYKDISNTSNIIKNKKIEISNILLLCLSITLIALSIFHAIKVIRLVKTLKAKKSAYDKYISKILKEYDRLIAESTTMTSFEDKEIIKVGKFTELLDIHDNLQLPVMYYSLEDHKKAYFYINHNNTIYLMSIKSIDLNNYEIEI